MKTSAFRHWCPVSTAIVLMIVQVLGCTEATVVKNWETVPNIYPLVVTTTTGEKIRLDHWQLKPDGMLVGTRGQESFAIRRTDIKEAAVIDETNQQVTQVAIIALASIFTVLIVYYVVGAVHGFGSGG